MSSPQAIPRFFAFIHMTSVCIIVRNLSFSEFFEPIPGATYLINPGSVGQPRDGIALASFGILDTNRLVYSNLRVAYGVQETQRKILQAGLPPELARRLAEGR